MFGSYLKLNIPIFHFGGGTIISPVSVNLDPWHGQSQLCSALFFRSAQPR